MPAASAFEEVVSNLRSTVARMGRATDSRSQTQAIASLLTGVRSFSRSSNGVTSAREAILDYLVEHSGTVIAGQEVEAVAGISEYARRLRELRAEGWRIVGGTIVPTPADMRAMKRLGIGGLSRTEYALLSRRRSRVLQG